ncbi:hypothetical protein [Neisseria bacilliformis]|uniref:hypothetical protein n=1 Tax=Neisseria bacilliformis TaxID=267212 RepID=UPI0028ED046F|nr:hypothetical protein [Neisseria bacilliformis]
MSLNPVYLWNPQNFPDPQAMLPSGFDAAHRIVSEWADQPLPQGADTSAFDKLAGYIAEAARSSKASADFKAAYADITTQVAEQLKSRAILELYEHYLELMPILTCRSESLGLVLYDANGYLLLPDGREYPDQETQDEITAYWRQREAEEQKWRQENRGLPKNIKDFYKYFRPKVDELMARHGFEYAPQLFNTEVHKRKKLEPDVIIYAKSMTNGQQTIYINYEDIYKDGEYSGLCLEWYLSDKEMERIYLHELDNIILTYGETEKKQLIAGGGGNIEYYLTQMWYHTGPSVSYKTETEIEALLAYWDQKLREVAWIDTYDDVEAYIDRHMIYQDSPEEASKHGFNTGILPRRLVIAYLRGQPDLAALADEWLYKKNYASINKQITIDNLAKTVPYLEKLCGQ